jgi:hypothetical protein
MKQYSREGVGSFSERTFLLKTSVRIRDSGARHKDPFPATEPNISLFRILKFFPTSSAMHFFVYKKGTWYSIRNKLSENQRKSDFWKIQYESLSINL